MKPNDLISLLLVSATMALVGCEGGYDGEPAQEPGTDGTAGEQEQEVEARTQRRTVQYGEWDADADELLGIEEFRSWWNDQDLFEDWTADGGDEVTRQEFAEQLHVEWDTNDDDVVSEVEWNEGSDRWFADEVDVGAWDDWDADGDSELDANEVAEGLDRNGLYDRVDRDDDAVIDDEEMTDWFFDIFDVNDDDRIDTTEWDAAKSNAVEG